MQESAVETQPGFQLGSFLAFSILRVQWWGWLAAVLLSFVLMAVVNLHPLHVWPLMLVLWLAYSYGTRASPATVGTITSTKRLVIGLVSLLLCFVLFAGATLVWALYEVPYRADLYLRSSPSTLLVLKRLDFIQFRDRPGYAGSLGRHGAAKLAEQANEQELKAWDQLEFLAFDFVRKTLLPRCLTDLHERKMRFTLTAYDMATETLIPSAEVEKLFHEEKGIAVRQRDCRMLVSTAMSRLPFYPKAEATVAKDSLADPVVGLKPEKRIEDYFNESGVPKFFVVTDSSQAKESEQRYAEQKAKCTDCTKQQQRLLLLAALEKPTQKLLIEAAKTFYPDNSVASSAFAIRALAAGPVVDGMDALLVLAGATLPEETRRKILAQTLSETERQRLTPEAKKLLALHWPPVPISEQTSIPVTPTPRSPGAAVDGRRLYEATCAACHGGGVAGAPRFGDKLAWADRVKRGNEVLHQHAIKGFQGKAGMMPPKGGAMATDDEVRAAVDYMVAAVK